MQDWCGPCRLMHAEVDKMQGIFKTAKFVKFNCGVGSGEEYAKRMRVRTLPTFRCAHHNLHPHRPAPSYMAQQ